MLHDHSLPLVHDHLAMKRHHESVKGQESKCTGFVLTRYSGLLVYLFQIFKLPKVNVEWSRHSCPEADHDHGHSLEPGGDETDRKAIDDESDSDNEPVGFLSFLKDRFSKPKASAKPKPVAAAAHPAPKGNRKAKASKPEEDNPPKRARKAVTAREPAGDQPDEGEGDLDLDPHDMSAADKTVIKMFEDKMLELAELDPPIGDAAFKSFMQERITALNGLMQELKAKKKSVGRRSNKDTDPLYQSLTVIESNTKKVVHLIKCRLAFGRSMSKSSCLESSRYKQDSARLTITNIISDSDSDCVLLVLFGFHFHGVVGEI